MVCPSTYPRSRSPCRKASRRDAEAEKELGMSSPSRGTCAAGCAWDVSGTVSRLRMSVTMHPRVLHHMVVSSRQSHADLLLSVAAKSPWQQACLPGEMLLGADHIIVPPMAGI